jgi:hypothetical protein
VGTSRKNLPWIAWIGIGIMEIILGLIVSWTLLWLLGVAIVILGLACLLYFARIASRRSDA